MGKPAVSVVVPCYNGGRFLDGLLASLAAQTFRDFEIIIIDDGSTDSDTRAKLATLPPHIVVLRQANAGLPAARNAGFARASADFILPLDCDDAIEPSFLAEVVPLLAGATDEFAFVFSYMRVTGVLEGILPRHFDRFDQLFLNRLPYCLLIRKSAWAAVGGYDETMREGYEDWEFNIRLTLAGYRGIEISRPLFVYHVSDGGMLLSHSARMHGKLWRGILMRHPDIYNFQKLRALRRRWRGEGARFGMLAAMILVWGGHILPDRLISLAFYGSLRAIHWFRIRRGTLSSLR